MSETDPTGDFLDRGLACPPSDALRAALRQRTTTVLRRRRHVRRGAVSLLLLLAGVGLGWSLATFLQPPDPPAEHPVRVVVVERPGPEKAPPGPAPREAPATPLDKVLSPAQSAEVKAHHDEKQAEDFRVAGDRYFEADDCASALRCYREYLNRGGPEVLAVASGDNWLLVSLKNARKKEQVHAE
jgi:hypothetical protein